MTRNRSSQVVMPETRRPQSWPGASMLGLVIGLACILFSGSHVWAAPTTADQAAAVVRGWLRHSTQPMNMPLGTTVGQVETFNDEQNQPAYYIVHVTTKGVPTSFVIVSADDDVEPIVGFTHGSTYDPSPANPLGALVSKDLPGRVKAAREAASQAASTTGPAGKRGPEGRQGGQGRRSVFGRVTREEACYCSQDQVEPIGRRVGHQLKSPVVFDQRSDLRSVGSRRRACGPLVQSQWAQGEIAGSPCYNYYTPNNYVCGCVATAMAQVMRFWQHPTAGIGVHAYEIHVNGVAEYRNTRGGDEDPQGNGLGGPYQWNDMPLVPDSTLTTAQRKAIGALCHDAGVAVNMWYASDGSGALPSAPVVALIERFGYASASLQFSGIQSFVRSERTNEPQSGCRLPVPAEHT